MEQSSIQIQTSEDRFILSIDKKLIEKEELIQLVERFPLEFLTKQVGFDENIEIFGGFTQFYVET